MELNQLQYFIAVAKHHSFSKASNAIHIAQSSLSHQVIKLESELGTQLFKRNTRSVMLTDAGKEFYEYACRVIEEMTQASYAMQKYSSLKAGHIVIGALPIMGYLGITQLIAIFHKAHPKIALGLLEAGSSILAEKLLSGDIDVAFLTPPTLKRYNQLDVTPLLEDNIVVVASKSHVNLNQLPIIDLKDLEHEKFILMGSDSSMRYLCESTCKTAGFIPKVILESNQVDTMVGLVASGLGITFLTFSVANAFRHREITIIPLRVPLKRITALGVISSNSNSLVKIFCQFVQTNKHLLGHM